MPYEPEHNSEPELHPLADIDQVIHAPARLMVLTYLYVVESADYVYLMRMTGLTWGNMATHLKKLEQNGYVEVVKEFRGKKPHSTIHLSERGSEAFKAYKSRLQEVLGNLPE